MKKIIALLLAAVMVMCLFAGCASSGGSKVIKIGVFEPQSGDNGAGGKQEVLGIQYANSVKPTVTINGETLSEMLPVLDFKNMPIPLESVTSFSASKSIKRCLVKNLALFGLGLTLWNGEELSEDAKLSKIKKGDEISAKQAEIVAKCKELATSGERRDALYAIIETYNGNKNPKSIKSVEICDAILAKINEEFGKEEK